MRDESEVMMRKSACIFLALCTAALIYQIATCAKQVDKKVKVYRDYPLLTDMSYDEIIAAEDEEDEETVYHIDHLQLNTLYGGVENLRIKDGVTEVVNYDHYFISSFNDKNGDPCYISYGPIVTDEKSFNTWELLADGRDVVVSNVVLYPLDDKRYGTEGEDGKRLVDVYKEGAGALSAIFGMNVLYLNAEDTHDDDTGRFVTETVTETIYRPWWHYVICVVDISGCIMLLTTGRRRRRKRAASPPADDGRQVISGEDQDGDAHRS